MNVLGVDFLQLIIYICVAASFLIVIYILKLARTRDEPETVSTLLLLLDKYVSHQLGIKPGFRSNPSSARKRKAQAFPVITKIDEGSYKPSGKAEKILEKIIEKVKGD